jgi:glutaredoxin
MPEAIYIYHDGANEDALAPLRTFFHGANLDFTVVNLTEDAAARENFAKWSDGRADVLPAVRVGEKIRSLFFRPSPTVLARLFTDLVSPENNPLTQETMRVYSANWCPDCRFLESYLNGKGVKYDKVDIEITPGAPEEIMRWSGGRRVVPTVRLGKDVALFNPGPEVVGRLLGLR